ncbi:GNAT family N-acetyltransferase [Microbacterium sp. STN6]|uniref:GNAT family N-acetyltransferase n=1 Tax=Microbacterium sp. STN6 TaxID=2995588 RepID=UPI0022609DEC|nr:GNAT family N-acetyltransferase [Microbacterium sp. STN6]MCX7522461.1 GNAT family N-acetyltransferase [Microbacterium sp. STN6]
MTNAFSLRAATHADAAFLQRMLLVAFNWDGAERFTLDRILAMPEGAHYVDDWPRADDFGVTAEDDDGPIGAAWARFLTAADPGYGFVAPDVPELTIGVEARVRGRGVGRALLGELTAQAEARGIRALSLSVEDNNGARRLYERAGFTTVGRNGGSDTMLLTLS